MLIRTQCQDGPDDLRHVTEERVPARVCRHAFAVSVEHERERVAREVDVLGGRVAPVVDSVTHCTQARARDLVIFEYDGAFGADEVPASKAVVQTVATHGGADGIREEQARIAGVYITIRDFDMGTAKRYRALLERGPLETGSDVFQFEVADERVSPDAH